MADLSDINAAQSVKIIGSGSTGIEATPVAATTSGGLHSSLRDGSGNEITSRTYDTVKPIDIFAVNRVAATATHTLVTPTSNTSTQLLAANPLRKWALFINNSGGAFFIKFGTAAVANQGIQIASNGGTFLMTNEMLYTGAVFGLVTSNARTIEMIEGT